MIVLIFGRQAAGPITAASWASVGEAVAATTFALGLGAIWLGGSLAVWSAASARSAVHRKGSIEATPRASLVSSLLILVALSIVQCAVLLAIVHWASGLRGPWLAMFGVLVLASAVGLSFGLLVSRLSRKPFDRRAGPAAELSAGDRPGRMSLAAAEVESGRSAGGVGHALALGFRGPASAGG